MKHIFVCSPLTGDITRSVKVVEALRRRIMRSGHAPQLGKSMIESAGV
jgi:UDP:flavonoid glycosyltransferase YjiC (YdhE family)